MRSFLGVPIVTRGEVLGAVYLTEKEDGSMFSSADQKLIELLAAHAAIAIENARLHERSRELSSSRSATGWRASCTTASPSGCSRVALAAESASTLLGARPRTAPPPSCGGCSELARGAMEELRAVVFELRPGSLEAEGLATVLRKHVEVLRRVYGRVDRAAGVRRAAARRRAGDAGAADRPGGARQRAAPRGGRR